MRPRSFTGPSTPRSPRPLPLTDSRCPRAARTDPAPPPPPPSPRLTRCWYRQTFPKPPVPSRSRISQGPPAAGRSPGGRSMGRERQPPQASPPVQGRFRAAELARPSARETYTSLPIASVGKVPPPSPPA